MRLKTASERNCFDAVSFVFLGGDEERFVSFISFQPQLYGDAPTTKRVLQVFLTTLSIIEQN